MVMMGFPSKCPSCGEVNSSGLDYCVVCGIKFKMAQQIPQGRGPSRRKLSKEGKLKLKREKKRGELTELFKRKKITLEQYRKGLKKLGYTTDIDKAAEFKKFIRSQIKDLKDMKVPPPGGPTERYDPYASKAELMRDDSGNLMTDFMVQPTPVNRKKMGAIMDTPSGGGPAQGPLFTDSLFAREPEPRMPAPGGYATRPVADKPRIGNIVKIPRLEKSPPTPPPGRRSSRRGLKMIWDEDESVDSSHPHRSIGSDEDESEDSSRLRRGVYSGEDESVNFEEDDFEIDLDEELEDESQEEELEDEFVIEDEDIKVEKAKKEVKVWWEDEEDDWWDEEGEGESGWWDDEDWELEDESEDDDDEYDLEDDEDHEEEKVEKRKGVKISWEEDDDDDDESVDSSDLRRGVYSGEDESGDSSYPRRANESVDSSNLRRGIRSESVGSDDDFEIEA